MPHPVLTRVGADDWPAGDGTIYDRSAFECGPVLTGQGSGNTGQDHTWFRPQRLQQAGQAQSCCKVGMQQVLQFSQACFLRGDEPSASKEPRDLEM